MDEYMQDNLRKALTNIYGDSVVKNWNMNEQMANIFLEYLAKEGQCNNSMAWVPRPWAPGKPPLKQIGKDLAKQLFKSAADKTPGCMNQSKSEFRSRFNDAGMNY